jgi:hypothetical protein
MNGESTGIATFYLMLVMMAIEMIKGIMNIIVSHLCKKGNKEILR